MLNRPPRAQGFDKTLAFRNDPYRFISSTCEKLGTDIFETRLLGRRVICMRGTEAATFFYNPNFTIRRGAAPEPLKATLIGKNSVQSEDHQPHRELKAQFLKLLSPEEVTSLADIFDSRLRARVVRWTSLSEVDVYKELQLILTESVCYWAGVPLDDDLVKRSKLLTALFDSISEWGFLRSRFARWRAEGWIKDLIREGRIDLSRPAGAIQIFGDERHFPLKKIAVEILNLLRPVVAVSVYIVFVVMALEQAPDWKVKIKKQNFEFDWFIQEVRRFYPFFPAVTAKARSDALWKDYVIEAGDRLIFDLYGTNHDGREWSDPESFRPERYLKHPITSFNMVAQGGGDATQTHRCPGEALTSALMKKAALFFSQEISYQIASSDLSLNFKRLPAMPKDGLHLEKVQWRIPLIYYTPPETSLT